MPKALVLFSGGLDSLLALRIMQDHPGIEVEGIHFTSLFTSHHAPESAALPARVAARRMGVPLRVEENGPDLLALIKAPRFGLGRNMNPCIDCRIRNVRRALEVMREIRADFIVTGEVVGERPMSQNRQALGIIDKEAATGGLLLRPLSAQLLPPTVPEEKGWVDRERLYAINGRCRKPQMELARQFGITSFPTPAGGCFLTEPGFSARLRDLLKHEPECGLEDCLLLKVGRHFRPAPEVKVVVGRNEQENERLESLARAKDWLMEACGVPGPLTLIRGPADDAALAKAAAITARYGKGCALPRVSVRWRRPGDPRESGRTVEATPASEAEIEAMRVARDASGRGCRGAE